MRRRALLRGASGMLAAQLVAPRTVGAARPRVVIIGAGWAGLACAFALTREAEAFDVLVFDREPVFRALPLSSAWLVGRTPLRLPPVELAALAQRQGWRFEARPVQAIDRAQRTVRAGDQRIGYDALVLATGAVNDEAAWFGDDARAAAEARAQFPAGFHARELEPCRQRLEAFAAAGGGTLLLTVPPGPYRCPPAPYERAALLAWWMQTRKLKARLILLDAGGGMPRFNRLFNDRYRAWVEHRPHQSVRRVDPLARIVATDDGDVAFDHALLLPPMHAGALAREAGLLGADSRWAAVEAGTLRSPHDERVWIVGDAMDRVSPLFGAYPKTAHIAADVGAAAAAQIRAALRGEREAAPAEQPRSLCHVWLAAEPAEQLVLDASYRRRGDGLIVQSVRQIDNPQPRDEDLQWARALMRERLGLALD